MDIPSSYRPSPFFSQDYASAAERRAAAWASVTHSDDVWVSVRAGVLRRAEDGLALVRMPPKEVNRLAAGSSWTTQACWVALSKDAVPLRHHRMLVCGTNMNAALRALKAAEKARRS